MTKVALLGTGLLGSGIAERLLALGNDVTVWNRTPARAEVLCRLGARLAETPAAAVRDAARVHLVLLDDATVDAVVDAMRPGLSPDAIVLDHTTNAPIATAVRTRQLQHAGIAYLHAPVFMSPAAARSQGGHMLVAGPRPLYEAVEAYLTPLTRDLWYVGERPDLAAAFKLFGNAMLFLMGAGLADVFHMADALGVDRAQVLGVFDRVRMDTVLGIRGKKVLSGDYSTSFTLTTARKDARLMIESAGDEPVPLVHALAVRMDELIASGHGGLDLAVLAKPGT